MKLKLTHSEFWALFTILEIVVNRTPPKGIQETILYQVMFRLFRKFHHRSLDTVRTRYGFTMDPDEACAFYLFFTSAHAIDLPIDPFTANLIHQINNHIHQKYAQ